MPQELKDLKVREVSLVDRGACREHGIGRARIALWKRDDSCQCTCAECKAGKCGSCSHKDCSCDGCKGCAMHDVGKAINADGVWDDTDELCKAVEGLDWWALVNKDGKTEDGVAFPKGDYAFTPDDTPSHWKLRLTSSPGGRPDPGIVGAAIAALGKGFRGKKVQIPAAARAAVVARVRAAWRRANPDKSTEDMPEILKGETTGMTPQEIEKRIGDLEAENAIIKAASEKHVTENTTLKAENDLFKAENDLILKMSKVEQKCYGKMSSAKKKEFMAGDGKKRRAMMADEGEPDGDEEAQKIERLLKAENERIAKAAADEKAAAEARIAKAEQAVAETKAELDAIKKRAELQTFITKAETELPNTPGSPETKGAMLMRLAKSMTAEEFNEHLAILKAGDKALGKDFIEVGKAATDSLPAVQLLEQKAQEIRKNDPKLSSADAYMLACELNPEIYKQADIEQQRATRRVM